MISPSLLSEKLSSQLKDPTQLNFSQKLQRKKKDQFFQKINKAMNIVTNPYDPFRVSLGLKFLDSSRERKALIDKIATIRYNDKQVKEQAEMNTIQGIARKAHKRFTSLMNNEIHFERDYVELRQKEESNLLLPSISRTRSRDISHLNCLSMEFEGLVIGSDKIISECNSRSQSITKRRRENTISVQKKNNISRQQTKVYSEPYFKKKI